MLKECHRKTCDICHKRNKRFQVNWTDGEDFLVKMLQVCDDCILDFQGDIGRFKLSVVPC